MSSLAQRLGKKLRQLRGDEPQLQFARRLGISNSSLNRMELGEQNVSLKTLETLCKRLKCDVGDLFGPRS
jgi:DNA-binding Xre family transcriptional regulator